MPQKYPSAADSLSLIAARAYVFGLSLMLLVWALVAWRTIGGATLTTFNYALTDPTPAAQPGNQLPGGSQIP